MRCRNSKNHKKVKASKYSIDLLEKYVGGLI